MKRLNIILGVILLIAALLVIFSEFFPDYSTLVRIISFIAGGIIGFIALRQVYYQHSHDSFKSSTFWYLWSAGLGFLVFGIYCATGISIEQDERITSFLISLCIPLMPLLGVFLGLISRMISNAIWRARMLK